MTLSNRFDVIVVGGGHAGVEAASAAARMGADTLLITQDPKKIGVMSCNPAIGGLGRGHIVREIDALGGVMGRATDLGGIQFRMLNRRKGPAVQGPRAQADRELYRNAVQDIIYSQQNLKIHCGEVCEVLAEEKCVRGVVLADDSHIDCAALVITTGTFLDGVIHRGNERIPAGRLGDPASHRLAQSLRLTGADTARLKTGTPPRLRSDSIDWQSLEMQSGDLDPQPFSYVHNKVTATQIECGITYTNARVHDFISANLAQAPGYNGAISGASVRYCPSIEDKVVKFPQRSRHQIFLEPEGRGSNLVYPNGISTALPPRSQIEMLRMIAGLERVEIVTAGYAIEYDFIDPRGLELTLERQGLAGLFLAGQINGTTGYEEAAGQGLIAGINAALRASGRIDRFELDRAQSYIGVMIDDIVSRGVDEPYRMFTSRAEYRLSMRADNADRRLTPIGQELGLVSLDRWQVFSDKQRRFAAIEAELKATCLSASELVGKGLDIKLDGRRQSVWDWLEHPAVDPNVAIGLCPSLSKLPIRDVNEVCVDRQYAPYLRRQAEEIAAYRRDRSLRLPARIDFQMIPGLSNEIAELLSRRQPKSLEAAERLSGMTPAAMSLLYRYVKAT